MSRITILCGSPRRHGNTARLAEAFREGASKRHDVRIIYVTEHGVSPCTGCNGCYRAEDHRCVRKDGMETIYQILEETDLLVAASPVYFYGISAQLKAVVDRLHAPHRNTLPIKNLGLILVGAAELDDLFDPIILQYRMIQRFFSLDALEPLCISGVREPSQLLEDALEKARALGASIV